MQMNTQTFYFVVAVAFTMIFYNLVEATYCRNVVAENLQLLHTCTTDLFSQCPELQDLQTCRLDTKFGAHLVVLAACITALLALKVEDSE